MKHTITFLLFTCVVLWGFSQKIGGHVSFGLPYNTTTDWSEPNFESEALAYYHVGKNFWTGAGVSYRTVGLTSSSSQFTYDREELSFFASGLYKADVLSWLSVLPQLRVGYTHMDFQLNQLNQLNDKKQVTGGLYVAEEVDLAFSIYKGFYITAGISRNVG